MPRFAKGRDLLLRLILVFRCSAFNNKWFSESISPQIGKHRFGHEHENHFHNRRRPDGAM